MRVARRKYSFESTGNFYPPNLVLNSEAASSGKKEDRMKAKAVRFLLALVAGTFLFTPSLSFAQANPCAGKDPSTTKNPCAVKPDKKAGKDKKGKADKNKKGAENPCAANPCAAKK